MLFSKGTMANPFAALQEEDEDEKRPQEESQDSSNLQQVERRKSKRKSRKQRGLLRRLKLKLLRILNFPKDLIVATLSAAWNAFLDVIGSRKRAADLEDTVKTLVSRIEALEKRKIQSPIPATSAMIDPPSSRTASRVATDQEATLAPSGSQNAISDPICEKYKKMLAVGVPEPAIRQKMIKDGVDPDLLFPPQPKPQTQMKVQFTRTVKTEVKTIQTPAPNQRSLNITVAALEEIRSSLRSSQTRPTSRQNDENVKPNGPLPGFTVSVSTLQEIRGSLRKAPRRTPESSKKGSTSGTKSPRIKDITNLRTRNETPLRTPFDKKQQQMSPSTARSDGEFLQLALLRKFQNVSSSPV